MALRWLLLPIQRLRFPLEIVVSIYNKSENQFEIENDLQNIWNKLLVALYVSFLDQTFSNYAFDPKTLSEQSGCFWLLWELIS